MSNPRQINDLPAENIGLGQTTQRILFALALLPFVGLVIGSNYAVRENAATRRLGRRLLMFSFWLHFIYLCCGLPTLLYLAFTT